jgi:hypothetical protein
MTRTIRRLLIAASLLGALLSVFAITGTAQAAPAGAQAQRTVTTRSASSGQVNGGTLNSATAMQPADWNGNCTWNLYSTSDWGWCDGTGPQRYQILAHCSNGYWYGSSSTPWFGDRRGAWAYCPSGTYRDGYGWQRA